MTRTTVGVQELQTHLNRYLQLVKAGEIILITEQGEPIGLLVPSRLPLEARMQALIQTGLVAWSGRKLAPITPVAEVRGRRTVADMLLEDRE